MKNKHILPTFIICLLFFTLMTTGITTNKLTAHVDGVIDIAQFAYVGSEGVNQNIYTINCDGTVINKITDLATGGYILSPPTWSPDGQKIAFSSAIDQTIYIINVDGTNLTPLTEGAFPSWSPDGQRMAFQNDGGNPLAVYVINIDGQNLQKIADSSFSNPTPDWSYDGKRLVFVNGEDLYTYNFDTKITEQITSDSGWEWRPKWSPTDNRIAYLKSNGSATGDIYILDLDGSSNIGITDSFNLEERNFDWSPDGTRISYGLNLDSNTYVMNADGTNPSLLYEETKAQAWRPGIDGCPQLTSNFSTGAAGSYFTLTGSNFPLNDTAAISVNGSTLGTVGTNGAGSFSFILSTAVANEGTYFVTAAVNPSATTSFVIDANEPVRPQEGTASIFDLPAGIAFTDTVFLPVVINP